MPEHPFKPAHTCGALICDENMVPDEEVVDVLLHDHGLYGVHEGSNFTGYVYCLYEEEADVMWWYEEVWTFLGFSEVYRAKDLQALLTHIAVIHLTRAP